jgi:hypothetical protein
VIDGHSEDHQPRACSTRFPTGRIDNGPMFTFGALFLLKDVLREVGEKLPKRRRKEDDEK